MERIPSGRPNGDLSATLVDWHSLLAPAAAEGPSQVDQLEALLVDQLAVADVVATSNPVAAMQYTLRAAGVGPTDEVLVTPFASVACLSAIRHLGACCRFIELASDSAEFDREQLGRAASPRTRAILASHIAGRATPLDELLEFAEQRDLVLLEDAQDALGATLSGRPVGGFGRAAVFRLPLGTGARLGFDAACVATTDPAWGDCIRRLRDVRLDGSVIEDRAWPAPLSEPAALLTRSTLLARSTLDRDECVQSVAESLAQLCEREGIPLTVLDVRSNARTAGTHLLASSSRRDAVLGLLRSRGLQSFLVTWPTLHLRAEFSSPNAVWTSLPQAEDTLRRLFAITLDTEVAAALAAMVGETSHRVSA